MDVQNRGQYTTLEFLSNFESLGQESRAADHHRPAQRRTRAAVRQRPAQHDRPATQLRHRNNNADVRPARNRRAAEPFVQVGLQEKKGKSRTRGREGGRYPIDQEPHVDQPHENTHPDMVFHEPSTGKSNPKATRLRQTRPPKAPSSRPPKPRMATPSGTSSPVWHPQLAHQAQTRLALEIRLSQIAAKVRALRKWPNLKSANVSAQKRCSFDFPRRYRAMIKNITANGNAAKSRVAKCTFFVPIATYHYNTNPIVRRASAPIFLRVKLSTSFFEVMKPTKNLRIRAFDLKRCPYCGRTHAMVKCELFKSARRRIRRLIKKQICILCLAGPMKSVAIHQSKCPGVPKSKRCNQIAPKSNARSIARSNSRNRKEIPNPTARKASTTFVRSNPRASTVKTMRGENASNRAPSESRRLFPEPIRGSVKIAVPPRNPANEPFVPARRNLHEPARPSITSQRKVE